MKKLLILSGKGGTGKTTISSSFIKLSKADAYADCDVDAPNLHLMVDKPKQSKKNPFYGLPKAKIDPEKCIQCGQCMDNCRFNAIKSNKGYEVDFYACEGCGVCDFVCPTNAISMGIAQAGNLMLYRDKNIFSTAKLNMGFGNSGMLVAEVKNQLDAEAPDSEYAIIDGSPGIGCPVIASISGVDRVLVVTEPSLSGISDMTRVIDTADGFMVDCAVCINKYDVNMKNTEKIEEICKKKNLPMTGRIPFDNMVVSAVNNGIAITDIDCPAGNAITETYHNTMKIFKNKIQENDNE